MKYKNWFLVLIANLFLVALLGLLMRYKIAFSLPLFEQKHLQHAHSHFAFTAWISQALCLALIHFLDKRMSINTKIYNRILLANAILSIGMMISFIFKGYHFSSNAFSFLIILNSMVFTYFFIRDAKRIPGSYEIKKWFYAALFFNFLSTFGTFYLVYMMMSKIYVQELQLSSVYFYLHFQYNGWFVFTCMGLMLNQISKAISLKNLNTLFWIFFLSAIPNYFLSILWMKISSTLYVLVVVSAIAQLLVWVYLLVQLNKHKKMLNETTDFFFKLVVWMLVIAFTIKLCLQLASTVPYMSHLAYSLRPIVIAYLHLVLLVIISTFLLQYSYKSILKININKPLVYFVVFILLNEFLLGIQGFAGVFMINVPNIHYYLLLASACIFISVFAIYKSLRSL